jgi:hypothetical protein
MVPHNVDELQIIDLMGIQLMAWVQNISHVERY